MTRFNKKQIACNREKCFAYHKGICQILRNTNFKGKPCPFFKEKDKTFQ